MLRTVAWCVLSVLLVHGCTTDSGQSSPDASLVVSLTLADGSQVDEVSYEVTGNGIDAITGVVDTSAPGSTASVEVFGIPPGQDYLITLTATTTDGSKVCEGAARFDVSAGVATPVTVHLGCKQAPRFGGVRANGELNICAELEKVIASPLQTSVANGLIASAEAVDAEGDPVAYRWSATGGSLSSPTTPVTVFTCLEDGLQTVEIEISDDGFEHCVAGWTIEITCVPGGDAVAAPELESSNPSAGTRQVSSVWIDLSFVEEVPDGALGTFSLECDGEAQPSVVNRLGDDGNALLVNPLQELPADASCALTWLGPDGEESLPFSTWPDGVSAEVPYDRTDATRIAPYPDDSWLVEDESQPTGVRVEPPVPDREPDVVNVFTKLSTAAGPVDGFSPLAGFVVELSDAPDPASLPNTPTESLDPLATVGLFDVDPASASYGSRIPFQLYQRSQAGQLNPDTKHALVVFPSIPLTPRGRYALVVTKRVLADLDRPFRESSFMRAVLDEPTDQEPAEVSATRAVLEQALAGLSAASPPILADDVALLTRFSIRSTDRFPLTPLRMREQVHALPESTFEITNVRGDPNPNLAAIVEGTWEAPEWRSGLNIARDQDGLPVVTGTKQVPFIIAIPASAVSKPAPLTMHQHGNPATAEVEVPRQARRYLAAGGNAVIGFTDNAVREVGLDTTQQQINVLGAILVSGTLPELWMQTTGEQLSFLRFVQQLADLDVVPVGSPDGQPDLDLSVPLTYEGISEGANKGQALVPYAPEIAGAALVAGGTRGAEILFFQDDVNPSGVGSELLDTINTFVPNVHALDLWLGLAMYQLAFDPQDAQNHAAFMYRNPLEVDGSLKKPSVLVQEGIDDTFVSNNATRSLVFTLGSTPLVGPVAEPVPFLMEGSTPLTANVDAQTTSGYTQYVPAGHPTLAPTPGCEFEFEGHFCAQVAPASLDQRTIFFQTAITDPAPTISDEVPPNLCVPLPDCNDDNPCTQDLCSPQAGCINPPDNGAPCEGGVCSGGACVPVTLCGDLELGTFDTAAPITCRFQGIPLGFTVALSATPTGPIEPGPVTYDVQTAVALQPDTVDLFRALADFATVFGWSGIVEATEGSDPSPLVTGKSAEACELFFPGGPLGVASDPVSGAWILEESASAQELTLQDIDLEIDAVGLLFGLTTIGNDASCEWDGEPPSLLFPR